VEILSLSNEIKTAATISVYMAAAPPPLRMMQMLRRTGYWAEVRGLDK
jgi:hypothetical protein